ncbi:MAG TPA: hypothetical protein VIG49_13645 [Acetobacteraceae bacterium]
MIRFVELVLFLAPFAAFAAWRLLAPERGPSPRFLAALACVLAAIIGSLIWFREEGAAPAGSSYVPSTLRDGQITPSESRTP